jgi:hypothetical protein
VAGEPIGATGIVYVRPVNRVAQIALEGEIGVEEPRFAAFESFVQVDEERRDALAPA